MIEIKSLRKEYRVGNNVHLALNDMSFTLPSSGMVFVLGKSGSGKTTLMNLIGGLDAPTSGEIIVNGNKISSFNENECEEYRNSHVGFVFQDFFLLEDYTIKENIEFSLKLQNKKDDDLIKKILTLVDLQGLENRYPSEISGGQKQRVAIARAIIKNPHIILADEPTGNLDPRTASSILDLLRDLSKERLVLIVSHNKEDAYRYADRLIEIEEGKIKRIRVRKEDSLTEVIDEENKLINLPYNIKLPSAEISKINGKLSSGEYKITQDFNHFEETEIEDKLEQKIDIKKEKMKVSDYFYFTKKFNYHNNGSNIFSSILVAIMVICLMISLAFSTFNGKEVINHVNNFYDLSNYVLEKGYYTEDINKLQGGKVVVPTQEDIDLMYDLGYEGNVYKLYSKTIPIQPKSYNSNFEWGGKYLTYTPNTLYSTFGRGVLDCDVDYLEKMYAKDGELNVLAGSLEPGFKDNGYVLTDYLADSFIFYNPEFQRMSLNDAYKAIVELSNIESRFTVKAIVETGYKERYSNLISVFLKQYAGGNNSNVEDEINKLLKSKEYFQFAAELRTSLAVSYYIGEADFYDAYFTNLVNLGYGASIPHSTTNFGDRVEDSTPIGFVIKGNEAPNEGEIKLSYRYYNTCFGTNISKTNMSEFTERTITITQYDHLGPEGGNVIYQKEFKITGIYGDVGTNILFSEEDYKVIIKNFIKPFALVFDNPDSISLICANHTTELRNFESSVESHSIVNNTVNIFNSFEILFIGFAVIISISAIYLMASQIKRSIKKKTYDIGVLKGLGLKGKTITNIFLSQLIIMCVVIISLVSVSLIFLDDLLNNILITNIGTKIPDMLKDGMNIISFELNIVIPTFIFVILVGVFTTFVLMFSLRRIKPINIIKSKEL